MADQFADPFRRCPASTVPPEVLTREQRIELLARAAGALAIGELPDDAARQFLSNALLNWLVCGGSLCRDHLQTTARQGSNETEKILYARIRASLRASLLEADSE